MRSEFILEQVGGTWHDWDENLSIEDRGGIETAQDGTPQQSHYKVDRIVTEIRVVPTYSHLDSPGWILERWYPAPFFGSPLAWENMVVPGTSVPRLGAYPSEGRYLMQTGPFPVEPDMTFIEDFISSWEERRESFPRDVEQHIKMRVQACIDRDERESAHAMQANEDRIMASVQPITSTSLEAGRWRSARFERAGQTSHIGN